MVDLVSNEYDGRSLVKQGTLGLLAPGVLWTFEAAEAFEPFGSLGDPLAELWAYLAEGHPCSPVLACGKPPYFHKGGSTDRTGQVKEPQEAVRCAFMRNSHRKIVHSAIALLPRTRRERCESAELIH